MAAGIALVVGGLAILALAAWSWAGRTRGARWWAGTGGSPVIAIGILPFFGLLLVAAGVHRLGGETLSPLTSVLVLLGFVLLVLGMFQPRFVMPRWYTDKERR